MDKKQQSQVEGSNSSPLCQESKIIVCNHSSAMEPMPLERMLDYLVREWKLRASGFNKVHIGIEVGISLIDGEVQLYVGMYDSDRDRPLNMRVSAEGRRLFKPFVKKFVDRLPLRKLRVVSRHQFDNNSAGFYCCFKLEQVKE